MYAIMTPQAHVIPRTAGPGRTDVIEINTPLLIRLLEMAREDFKTDAEIHYLVEALMSMKLEEVTMKNYEELIRRFEALSGK